MENIFEAETGTMDLVTVSAIKAQVGTKRKIDNLLADFGVNECPADEELLVLLTGVDGKVDSATGNVRDDIRYKVDTSSWSISLEEGDFNNTMLVATFYSKELGQLRDSYVDMLGDDTEFDIDEGDTEFTLVLCSDVGDVDDEDLDQLVLSFSGYIPFITFQSQVVGVLSSEQMLSVLNGLTITQAKEMEVK